MPQKVPALEPVALPTHSQTAMPTHIHLLVCALALLPFAAHADHLGVSVTEGVGGQRVSAEIADADLAHLLAELAARAGIEAVGLETLTGRAGLIVQNEPLDAVLRRLLHDETFVTRHRMSDGQTALSALAVIATGGSGRVRMSGKEGVAPAKSDATPVTRHAIRALAHRGDAEAMQALLDLATGSDDALTRTTAARALLIYAEMIDEATILTLLESAHEDLRHAAARILARSASPDAATQLISAYHRTDETEAVRIAVLRGLGQLETDEAMRFLAEAASGNGDVADQARRILSRVSRRPTDQTSP